MLFRSLQVFQSAHLRLCGLPMDDQGLSLEALEKHLRQSSDRGNSVLYTIPTNHNPTGRTLSRRRRIQLLFRSRLPMELLFRKAVSAGVLINPGDIYSSRHTQSLRLSYAYTTPEEFRRAVSQLAVVVRSLEG